MPAPDYQYTVNRFPGDGTTTSWELNFAGGYLSKSHIKAYVQDAETLVVLREITLASGDWLGPNTIKVEPAILVTERLTVYRDTPKDMPLVNFSDGSIFVEQNLDTLAKQAVFVAAEMVDRFGDSVNESNSAAAAAQAARDAAIAAAADAAAVAAGFLALQTSVADALAGQDADIAAFVADVNAQIAAFEASVNAANAAFQLSVNSQIDAIESDVADVLAAVLRYDIGVYSPDKPTNNSAVMAIALPRAMQLQTDAAECIFIAETGPVGSSAVLNVYKNATLIGTITFAAASFTGVAAITQTDFVAGDKLRVVSTYPDASTGFNGIGLTFRMVI